MSRVQLTTTALGQVNSGLHHNGHFENLHVLLSLSVSPMSQAVTGASETHLVNILLSALECEYHRTARRLPAGHCIHGGLVIQEYRVMVPPRVVG